MSDKAMISDDDMADGNPEKVAALVIASGYRAVITKSGDHALITTSSGGQEFDIVAAEAYKTAPSRSFAFICELEGEYDLECLNRDNKQSRIDTIFRDDDGKIMLKREYFTTAPTVNGFSFKFQSFGYLTEKVSSQLASISALVEETSKLPEHHP